MKNCGINKSRSKAKYFSHSVSFAHMLYKNKDLIIKNINYDAKYPKKF